MSVPIIAFPAGKPAGLDFYYTNSIHYQTPPDQLVKQSLQMGEGQLSDTGALVIKTGEFTGRSPKDRFIVDDEITTKTVDWNEFNQKLHPDFYFIIRKKNNDIPAFCAGFMDT